jgi:two-component system response regulator FixJ
VPASLRSRPRILLADHDAAVRTALAFSLEMEGFRVETFESGEALLRAPLPHRRGCLVLDQNLPGLSGLEALVVLRSRGVSLPALLITSLPTAAVRKAAACAGVTIIDKPLLNDDLGHAIWDVLLVAAGASSGL